jgi:hypothetical protein
MTDFDSKKIIQLYQITARTFCVKQDLVDFTLNLFD